MKAIRIIALLFLGTSFSEGTRSLKGPVHGVQRRRTLRSHSIDRDTSNGNASGNCERATNHGPEVRMGMHTRQASNETLQGKTLVIMPLGDSITDGYQSTDGNGYRNYLLQDLAGNTVVEIGVNRAGNMSDNYNEGYNGAVITEIAAHFANDSALLSAQPNIVLLHAGTNDLNMNIDVATAPSRLGSLIDQVHAKYPSAAILVAQIIPSGSSGTESLIVAFNQAIPCVVAQRASTGQHVLTVDMFSALSFPADYTDVLHPNDQGYKKIADVWFEALQYVNQIGWLSGNGSSNATSTATDTATATTASAATSGTAICTSNATSTAANTGTATTASAAASGTAIRTSNEHSKLSSHLWVPITTCLAILFSTLITTIL